MPALWHPPAAGGLRPTCPLSAGTGHQVRVGQKRPEGLMAVGRQSLCAEGGFAERGRTEEKGLARGGGKVRMRKSHHGRGSCMVGPA